MKRWQHRLIVMVCALSVTTFVVGVGCLAQTVDDKGETKITSNAQVSVGVLLVVVGILVSLLTFAVTRALAEAKQSASVSQKVDDHVGTAHVSMEDVRAVVDGILPRVMFRDLCDKTHDALKDKLNTIERKLDKLLDKQEG